MDCRGLGMDAEALDRFMLTEARLWLDRARSSVSRSTATCA
jgi:cystathionine beta-lyase